MDLESDFQGLAAGRVFRRAAAYLAWLALFLGLVWLVGVLPTLFLFTVAYMRVEGRERWRLVLGCAAGLTAFCYVLFDRLLLLPWPRTLVGEWLPVLHGLVPSL